MLGTRVAASKPQPVFNATESNLLFFLISKFKNCETPQPCGSQVKGKMFRPRQSGTDNENGNESDDRTAGRRRWWLLAARFGESIREGQKFKPARRDQNESRGCRWKFEFFQLQREFVFLFGFFAGSNGLAQTARMLAVKRAGHRLDDRMRAQIVREHGCPSHRLQRGPMRAGRNHQRHHHTTFAKAGKHNGKLHRLCQFTSANNDLQQPR